MTDETDPTTDGDVDRSARWKDAHSVTCVVCGGLADERETDSLWDAPAVNPLARRYDLSDVDDGEAHPVCVEQLKVTGDITRTRNQQ